MKASNISNYQGSTITSYTPSYLESTIVNKLTQQKVESHRTDLRIDVVLNILDLEYLNDMLVKNRLNFNDLLFLTKDDLVELDVSMMARNRILRFAEAYKQYGKEYTVEEIFDFFNKFKSFIIKPLSNEQPKQIYAETILPTASFHQNSAKRLHNSRNYVNSEVNLSPKFTNTIKKDQGICSLHSLDIGSDVSLSDHCSNRRGSDSEERASQTVPTSISKKDNPFEICSFDRFKDDHIEPDHNLNLTKYNTSKLLTSKLYDLKVSESKPTQFEKKDKLTRHRKNHKIQKEYTNLTSDIDNYLKSFEKLKEKSNNRQNRLKCLIRKSTKSRSRSKSKPKLKAEDLEVEEERNLNEEINRLMGRINSASKLDHDNQSQIHLNRIKSLADQRKDFKKQDINYINKEIDKLYDLINRKREIQTNLSKCNQSILDGKKVTIS
jgi:hypothetical protein